MKSTNKQPSVRKIISEYIERKDLLGLADYFRAYIEDDWKEFDSIIDSIHKHYQEEIEKIIEKIGITYHLTYHYDRQHIIDELTKLITPKIGKTD